MNSEGFLISISGIDGCGKSTIVREIQVSLGEGYGEITTEWVKFGVHPLMRLLSLLRGSSTLVTQQNNATQKWKGIFRHLYFVYLWICHVSFIRRRVTRALSKGGIVICDRYIYDTIVDLVLAFGMSCQDAESKVLNSQFPIPDVAIWLDIDPELAAQRKGTVISTNQGKERRILYKRLALEYRLITLNGAVPLDQVRKNVLEFIMMDLERK